MTKREANLISLGLIALAIIAGIPFTKLTACSIACMFGAWIVAKYFPTKL